MLLEYGLLKGEHLVHNDNLSVNPDPISCHPACSLWDRHWTFCLLTCLVDAQVQVIPNLPGNLLLLFIPKGT